MDLDEWELVPRDDEFIHHQTHSISKLSNTKSVIDMNYFQKCIDHIAVKHCPDQKDQNDQHNENCIHHIAVKHCSDQNDQTPKEGCDQENMISQVFATRMDENKFVDIEMDCPMSENKGLSACDELEDKDGDLQEEEEEEIVKKEEDESKNRGLNNMWKWAMSGIGAVFSFGFLAASVSLVALGKRPSIKEGHSYNTSEIHFQIYTHNKRMKRVVKRTKRLNEAIAAVRGAPYMTRAHVTVGGYYDGL